MITDRIRLRRAKKRRLREEEPLDEDFETEDELERYACRYAERRGLCAVKMELPGLDHWPDRLFFGRDDREARAGVFLVEFKDFGEEARPMQYVTHEYIRRRYRTPVYVVDRWSSFLNIWRIESDGRLRA